MAKSHRRGDAWTDIRSARFAIVTLPLLLISAIAYPAYPGSFGIYLLFDVSFIAMLLLALPAPRSHAYVFFAFMLFLGFWSKLMFHLVYGTNFLEPTGTFSGKSAEWNRALGVASAAAIGVSIARVIQLTQAGRLRSWITAFPAPVPPGYRAWRRTIWIASILAMLGLNLLNFQVAFYQTGVNPTLILPLHLNVPLGWLINIGFAFWFAVLIQWEFRTAPQNLAATLFAPIIEGVVSSASALSRSFYIIHTVSYFFALSTQWTGARAALSRRLLVGLMVLWTVCFAVSLALASWLRIHIYFLAYEPAVMTIPAQKQVPSAPIPGAATATGDMTPLAKQSAINEVGRLFVQRWVGLEGVLAVSSYPNLGFGLFSEAIRVSPKTGNASVYQVISKSQYEASERFSFATLPGIVAILFYSGSLAVVVAGTMLVTLLMIGTEFAALRYTANPFLASMMALGLANVACQVQFPYLAAIFVAQLWVTIAFVWLISATPDLFRWRRSPANPSV